MLRGCAHGDNIVAVRRRHPVDDRSGRLPRVATSLPSEEMCMTDVGRSPAALPHSLTGKVSRARLPELGLGRPEDGDATEGADGDR
jgi:hypothetical protein